MVILGGGRLGTLRSRPDPHGGGLISTPADCQLPIIWPSRPLNRRSRLGHRHRSEIAAGSAEMVPIASTCTRPGSAASRRPPTVRSSSCSRDFDSSLGSHLSLFREGCEMPRLRGFPSVLRYRAAFTLAVSSAIG